MLDDLIWYDLLMESDFFLSNFYSEIQELFEIIEEYIDYDPSGNGYDGDIDFDFD